MSSRELLVLGTASQVPTRHRNHNGYFLRWDEHGFLFDPGEGTQRQMVHFGLNAAAITRILVTHFHGDHCLGLAGIVQRISLDRVPHTVDVHYPASGQVYFERLRGASIFFDQSHLAPHGIEDSGEIARNDAFTITARRLDHGVDCFGYRIQEPDRWNVSTARLEELGLRGPLVGQLKREGRIEHGGRVIRLEEVATLRRGQSVAFVMDTRACPAAIELARDVDLFVCEATFLHSEIQEAQEYGHMTARQAAEIAREAGALKLVLTHFSQRYESSEPFLAEARAIHGDVVAAEDGLVVPLRTRRELRAEAAELEAP
ncbi:MAG: ribonuclease Z [Planctomycetes bacterium]|nr:ribonuclease Z [Planctomycetota bacterium]